MFHVKREGGAAVDVGEFIGLAGVPVIVGLVEVGKLWVKDSRWYPLMALACGVSLNVGAALILGRPVPEGVLTGVVAGLAASGLYSGVRAGLASGT
jgi:hypothetical protein